MHHNILLRFEFILIALAKIANHNKYITNRNPVKQKKAEDIFSVRSSIKLQGSNEPSQLIFFTTEDPKNEENDY